MINNLLDTIDFEDFKIFFDYIVLLKEKDEIIKALSKVDISKTTEANSGVVYILEEAYKRNNPLVIDCMIEKGYIKEPVQYTGVYWQILLHLACSTNNLNAVRYLLTSPKTKDKIDINKNEAQSLYNACANDGLEIIKYLLTSPELTVHADIGLRVKNCLGFLTVAYEPWENKAIEIARYLLLSPELKEHIDIHHYEDQLFKEAAKNDDYPFLEFLIFECNIEITPDIEVFINKEIYADLKLLFEKRELNEALHSHLNEVSGASSKKVKI